MNYYQKVLLFLFLGIFVQASSPDCKERIRNYIKEMGKVKESDDKIYYMHYEVLSYGRDNAETKSFVKMMVKGNTLVYESNYLSVYQDEKEVYSLVHPQKTIVKSKPNSAKIKEMRTKQGMLLQDSIFKVSTLKSCTDAIYNNVPVRVTELAMTAQGSKTFKVSKVIYYFNEKQNKLEKQELYYVPGAQLVKQEIVFREMTFDYKGKVKRSARDYIYPSGKLDKKYKEYKFEN